MALLQVHYVSCKLAEYCWKLKNCQLEDWKAGHKILCSACNSPEKIEDLYKYDMQFVGLWAHHEERECIWLDSICRYLRNLTSAKGICNLLVPFAFEGNSQIWKLQTFARVWRSAVGDHCAHVRRGWWNDCHTANEKHLTRGTWMLTGQGDTGFTFEDLL